MTFSTRIVATACALLLPLLLHAAAGHTAYSAYLQKIPAPPQTAPEAHARYSATGHSALLQSLNQEAALASAQAPSAMPALPQAGDVAAAERMAAEMQNMTPAQQMAMAMQMANTATQGMQGGGKEWSQAEQEVARLLGDHQERAGELQSRSTEVYAEAPVLMQSWGPAHSDLFEQERVELERPQRNACVEGRAIKMKYAAKHESLAAQELPLLAALINKHRVLATEQVGFVDHLATKAKTITSATNQAAYAQARSFAITLLTTQATLTGQALEYGYNWHQRLLDSQKPVSVDCSGM